MTRTSPTALPWLERVNPQVHEVWIGRWRHQTVEPQRQLIDHELVLFADGLCEMEIERRLLRCPAGTFVIVPPGSRHVTRALDGSVLRCCVHFDWIASRPAPSGRLWTYTPFSPSASSLRRAPEWLPEGLLHGNYARHSRIDTLMQTLRGRWASEGAVDRATCRALLLEILLSLLCASAPSPEPRERIGDLAATVRRKLDDLPIDSMTAIVPLLESLGYRYEYLCRCFTKRYGIAPLQYVTHTRMERAKVLLRDRQLKVAAVAAELGYRDAGYFIRRFRRYTGMTPGRFASHFGESIRATSL